MNEIEQIKESIIKNYGKKEFYIINKAEQLLHKKSITKRYISDFVVNVLCFTDDINIISNKIIEIIIAVTENYEDFLCCSESKNKINLAASILEASNDFVDIGEKIFFYSKGDDNKNYVKLKNTIKKYPSKKIEKPESKKISHSDKMRESYIIKILNSDNFIKLNNEIYSYLDAKDKFKNDINYFFKKYENIDLIKKMDKDSLDEISLIINKIKNSQEKKILNKTEFGEKILIYLKFVLFEIILNENNINKNNCSFSDLYFFSNKVIGYQSIKKDELQMFSNFKNVDTTIDIHSIIEKYNKINSKLIVKEAFTFLSDKEKLKIFELFSYKERNFITLITSKLKKRLDIISIQNEFDNNYIKIKEERTFKIIKKFKIWTKALCIKNENEVDFICKIKNIDAFSFDENKIYKLSVVNETKNINGIEDYVFTIFIDEDNKKPYIISSNKYYNEYFKEEALALNGIWSSENNSWIFPGKNEDLAIELEELHFCDPIKVKAVALYDMTFKLPLRKKDEKIHILGLLIIGLNNNIPFIPSKIHTDHVIEDFFIEEDLTIFIKKGSEFIIDTTENILIKYKNSKNDIKYNIEKI